VCIETLTTLPLFAFLATVTDCMSSTVKNSSSSGSSSHKESAADWLAGWLAGCTAADDAIITLASPTTRFWDKLVVGRGDHYFWPFFTGDGSLTVKHDLAMRGS
jgi:hypothetical protein